MTDFLTRLTPRPNIMPARKPTPVTISNDEHEIKIYTTESHGRPLHQLSFYRGGKRERRSFADLNEAKREARIILGGLARDGIQAENLTGAEIQSYVVARRVLAPLETPVHLAAEAFVAARQALPADTTIQDAVIYFNRFNRGVERRQIRDLAAEYLAARRASGVTENYLDSIRRYLREFGRHTTGRMLPDLRACDVDDFLQAQTAWGPRSKNDARQKLITFGNWAKGRGFLPRDWREFDGSVTYLEPVMDVTIYTPEEMERLLNAAGKHLATPFVAIGGFAGLRSAEIQRLDWKNIHLDRGFIEVRADICKTRSRRLVPISDNLRAWLQPFAMPSGRVVMHHSIAEALKKIAARVGLTLKRNALRHSFVSYRLALTHDPARTALEAGHDQTILFQYYREVVTPELAAQWFAIMPPIEMQRGLVGICRGTIGKPQRKGVAAAEIAANRVDTIIAPS
jgi:integrase